MVEPQFITKKELPLKSMDFAFLRKEAVEYLQKICATTWTDHNTHDPGITMLEALCYVITDLGNRINLPIEDILASQPNLNAEKLKDIFSSAQDILPSCASTLLDYRKLLIDVNGVRNILIKKASSAEHPIFFVETPYAITYNPSSQRIDINGLYIFQIEFEESSVGDLNDNIIDGNISVTVGGDIYEFNLEMVFPYWDEIEEVWMSGETISSVTVSGFGAVASDAFEDYFARFNIVFSNSEIVTDFPVNIKVTPSVDGTIGGLNAAVAIELQSYLQGILPDAPFQIYWNKLQAIKIIIDKIQATYCANRNLCEDLLRLEARRVQEIGMNAIIEVEAGFDPAKIIAEVVYQIEQFFSPEPRFYSLSELLEEQSLDQILEGPLLNNGFIKDKDFDVLNSQSIIYTSDLVRVIMNIEGVIAVNHLLISNFINNIVLIEDEPNCLRLTSSELYVPRFSVNKSCIQIRRQGEVVAESVKLKDEILDCLQLIKIENTPPEIVNDLSIQVKEGTPFSLQDYWSVQYEFPKTYGIGIHQLSLENNDQRKAKVKQLQGYLLLFDQILANLFAQLANVCEAFSLNYNSSLPYFAQPLYEVPNIQALLTNFYAVTDDWDTFINDVTNSYFSFNANSNSPEKSFERKNLFLNHQLARYAQSFEEYEKVMKGIPSYDFNDQIIIDKTNYLKSFPQISKARGKGFDYKKLKTDGTPDVWDTDNITGLAMNLCRRLGFTICRRHDLYHPLTDFFEVYDEDDTDGITELRFRLRNYDGDILLSSSTHYLTMAELWAEVEETLKYISRRSNYQIITATNGAFYFNLLNDTGDVIARRIEPFSTLEEIEISINEVIEFAITNYSGEGVYVIEHTLLRPKIKGTDNLSSDSLLTVPEIISTIIEEDNTPKKCGVDASSEPIPASNIVKFPLADPYSFVITVIFPSGYQKDFSDANAELTPSIGGVRFRNIEFRRLIAKILREEAPASVFIHEVYLDINTGVDLPDTPSLNNVQQKYRTWLEVNANPSSTQGAKLTAQKEWVLVLNQIHDN